jgi:uncharacterized protein YegL
MNSESVISTAQDAGISITLLIDHSGSMTSEGGIASASDFQRRLVSELTTSSRKNNVPIWIRALHFSDRAEWQQVEAMSVDQFEPTTITAGQFSNFGNALKLALDAMVQQRVIGKSILIWIGDGFVTDEWLDQAERMRTDPEFQELERYAVHPEGRLHHSSLRWFAGAHDRVIPARAADNLIHDLPIPSSSPPVNDWDDEVF